jgi:hypothetical protein
LPAPCGADIVSFVASPKEKAYRIAEENIKPVAVGYGGCFATDMITVDGKKVAFMYRQTPATTQDSGWRFMSGFESDEYMADKQFHGIFNVNTIANYDPDIIPLLDSPVGSAFERKDGEGQLVPVEDFRLPD